MIPKNSAPKSPHIFHGVTYPSVYIQEKKSSEERIECFPAVNELMLV